MMKNVRIIFKTLGKLKLSANLGKYPNFNVLNRWNVWLFNM